MTSRVDSLEVPMTISNRFHTLNPLAMPAYEMVALWALVELKRVESGNRFDIVETWEPYTVERARPEALFSKPQPEHWDHIPVFERSRSEFDPQVLWDGQYDGLGDELALTAKDIVEEHGELGNRVDIADLRHMALPKFVAAFDICASPLTPLPSVISPRRTNASLRAKRYTGFDFEPLEEFRADQPRERIEPSDPAKVARILEWQVVGTSSYDETRHHASLEQRLAKARAAWLPTANRAASLFAEMRAMEAQLHAVNARCANLALALDGRVSDLEHWQKRYDAGKAEYTRLKEAGRPRGGLGHEVFGVIKRKRDDARERRNAVRDAFSTAKRERYALTQGLRQRSRVAMRHLNEADAIAERARKTRDTLARMEFLAGADARRERMLNAQLAA